MKLRHYVLDDQHRVRPADMIEWARFFDSDRSIVRQTRFACGVLVSTIFLGMDHRFFGKGPPLLFETMVFELTIEGDSDEWRYSSWDDAEAGHAATVRRVKAQLQKAGLATAEIKEPIA